MEGANSSRGSKKNNHRKQIMTHINALKPKSDATPE